MSIISALFVATRGVYSGLPGVDPWGEKRDARRYDGSSPVVAHPPCSRWCRLAGLVEARWGHRRGDDGGCFASALASVRRCGGVLEHPAYSAAWPAYGLVPPSRHGGWAYNPSCGGWTTHVEQVRYGHPAKKATWLYVVGINAADLPTLRWGSEHDKESTALVSWCGNRVRSGEKRRRLSQRESSATPAEFRDVLLAIARSTGSRES